VGLDFLFEKFDVLGKVVKLLVVVLGFCLFVVADHETQRESTR